MTRLIRSLLILFIGSWFFLLATQQATAQQPVRLPGDPVRIADFGLEGQISSALDLVGPEDGSAGRNRAVLVHRLQCWIDGIEGCSVADQNDPRVRAIRRFLGLGPVDRDGAVIVHFPDETRIEVRLERVADLDPNDWDQSVYEPVVLPDTARAPGLPTIPAHRDQFRGFAHEGGPEVQAALDRLKQRFEAPAEAPQGAPPTAAAHAPVAERSAPGQGRPRSP